MKSRSVLEVIESLVTHEGAGFLVHRPFPTRDLDLVDPFLLLDEMGPSDHAPGAAKGAPDHPHRGFETVTYMLDGSFEHRDSAGNHGLLRPGDVQWMTAGAGVVHSEMPSRDLMEKGGRLHGIQLWVNLPRAEKRIPPRYQDTPAARIPIASVPGVTVKVIAGEALGAHAVIETRTPILYLHVTLEQGARFEQAVPPEWNAFAYVLEGRGAFGNPGKRGDPHQLVLFERDGDVVTVEGSTATQFLLIAGRPLGEPVVRYGPFVMNTTEEIREAFDDFRAGRMGEIG